MRSTRINELSPQLVAGRVHFDLGTSLAIDVCEYPDSREINILPYKEVFERSAEVDYHKGEEGFPNRWPHEILRKTSTK